MSERLDSAGAPSTVIFDLGGVLIDWDPRYLFRTLLPSEDAVERFLAEVCTPEWNAAQDAGRPWPVAVAELIEEFPDQAELISAYNERWWETIGGDIPETVELLRSLRDGGVRLYALTNWSAEKFDLTYPRFEWLSWFGGIVVSGKEGVVKPDQRIFRILLERYDIDPVDAVYIDDVERNVATAAELGLRSLRFTGPKNLRDDLAALGLPTRQASTAGQA
ncbi:MAG TPA: HAD family phosphatase [Jiangellaceae bacterium]|nr:HAD family phosphatase [Jiangellaceae bacterium]